MVSPADACTFCREKCEFVDVTCYIPECEGSASGNINQQVFRQGKEPHLEQKRGCFAMAALRFMPAAHNLL
jgi:hypothetical protein